MENQPWPWVLWKYWIPDCGLIYHNCTEVTFAVEAPSWAKWKWCLVWLLAKRSSTTPPYWARSLQVNNCWLTETQLMFVLLLMYETSFQNVQDITSCNFICPFVASRLLSKLLSLSWLTSQLWANELFHWKWLLPRLLAGVGSSAFVYRPKSAAFTLCPTRRQ